MRPIQALISMVGRVLLAAIFLASALMNHIPHFNDVVASMEKEGVPNARMAHFGALALMLIGSVSVVLGFTARLGALMLAVFLVAATYYFHDFWTIEDAVEKQQQMTHFMKNTAILGGLVFMIANGSGAGSVDRRRVTIEV